jgi:hypothetical protein
VQAGVVEGEGPGCDAAEAQAATAFTVEEVKEIEEVAVEVAAN